MKDKIMHKIMNDLSSGSWELHRTIVDERCIKNWICSVFFTRRD